MSDRFPNDVLLEVDQEKYLIECKVRSSSMKTNGEKIAVFSLDWIRGVIGNAKKMGYRMGIVVFQAKYSRERYVVLSLDDFFTLLKSKNT